MEGNTLIKYIYTYLTFYTNINIILVIFYKYTAKYYDLHLSCMIVALVSFGITYIYPREIIVNIDENTKHVYPTGTISSIIVDFIMHWIPLIFVFAVVPIERNKTNTIRTFAIIVLYIIAFQAHDLYNFNHFISILFMILALVARFSL